MLLQHLMLLSVLVLPVSGFAQVVEKGERVPVTKGTRLCTNLLVEQATRWLDPEKVFWRVTSQPRANGTQTVASFLLETVYNRKSGETTIKESSYEDDYATYFKTDPDHKGMYLMVSPRDGRVEAIVEVCRTTR